MTFLARGDVALSVTITSCTTLLAPIMTPALMYLFASQWLAIDPTAMFMSIVQIILLPIAAGVLVHKLLGARIDTAVAALPLVSVLAIVLIAAAVTAASRQQLMNTGLLVFVAVVLHNALGMLFGFLVAKWSGMNLAKCKCMAFEVGMQNSGLGVALASVHFAANPMTALPAAIAALWHNVTGRCSPPCSSTGMKKAKRPPSSTAWKRSARRPPRLPPNNRRNQNDDPPSRAATIPGFPSRPFAFSPPLADKTLRAAHPDGMNGPQRRREPPGAPGRTDRLLADGGFRRNDARDDGPGVHHGGHGVGAVCAAHDAAAPKRPGIGLPLLSRMRRPSPARRPPNVV